MRFKYILLKVTSEYARSTFIFCEILAKIELIDVQTVVCKRWEYLRQTDTSTYTLLHRSVSLHKCTQGLQKKKKGQLKEKR